MKYLQLSVSPLTVQRHLNREKVVYKQAKHSIIMSRRHKHLCKERLFGEYAKIFNYQGLFFPTENDFFRMDQTIVDHLHQVVLK